MPPPASHRAGRVGRAGAAAAVAAIVALAAHLAGGGGAPPVLLLAGLVVLLWPAAILLTGRQPRLWRQAAVIALVQGGLHAVLAALPSGGASPVVGSDTTGMAGMHGMPVLGALPAPVDLPAHDAGMWGWHCVAWLATTAVWRWGERAVLALLDRLPLVARLALAACAPPPSPLRRRTPRVVAPAPAPIPLDGRPRRGPPLAV